MLNRNVSWSLAGGAIPAIAALVCTPYMLAKLDIEHFAVTSLIISITIFFYVFDLGMSKAMTFFTSKQSPAQVSNTEDLVGSAIVSTGLIAVVISLIAYLLVPFFVDKWMNLSNGITEDAKTAFQYALLGIVPGLISNVLKGVLEGNSKFKEANICKIISGAGIFLAPIIVVMLFNENLIGISIAIVLSRYLSLFCYFYFATPLSLVKSLTLNTHQLKSIWRYALWAGISGFISTAFIYGDRFFVAGYISSVDLSSYIAVQDILNRYLLVPWSMAIVLMPTFSAGLIDKHAMKNLYIKQQKHVSMLSLVFLSAAVFIAFTVIQYVSFDIPNSTIKYVVSIQAFGIFFCSLSQLPLIYLFGKGVPKLITKIFVSELIVYILVAPIVFNYFGLIGACLIWSSRHLMECLLLNHFAKRIMK